MREVEVKHITLSSSLKSWLFLNGTALINLSYPILSWYLRGKQSQSPFVVDFRNLILLIMQREKCNLMQGSYSRASHAFIS